MAYSLAVLRINIVKSIEEFGPFVNGNWNLASIGIGLKKAGPFEVPSQDQLFFLAKSKRRMIET